MELKLRFALIILSSLLLSQTSFAALDDGLALKRVHSENTAKIKLKKSVRSKNDKKLVATSTELNKQKVLKSVKSSLKSLGAVPRYVKENWNSLSNDQKEVVFSYHNENPYSEINKEHFKNISEQKPIYEHDTDFGFDPNQQANLEDLRDDINGQTTEELPEDMKVIVEALAALESDI